VTRRLIIALVVAGVCACAVLVPTSGATFTCSSSSSVEVTADKVQNWLHLYSQSTDPDGLTGYCTQAPTSNPAATGMDETLTVNLGSLPKAKQTTCNRVFTIKTPASFPTGTSATVTAALVADSGSGAQPVTSFGFANVGTNGTYTNPVSLGVGQKRQFNVRVKPATAGTVYYPKVLITVTYSGMTATYYQYTVTLKVTGQ
jgi:hypothetical protein